MAKLRNAAKSITDGTAETPEWSDAVDDLRQRSDSTMLCLQEIRAELREARRHHEALEASRVVAEAYHAALKAAVFDLQRQLTPFSPMLHGSVILPNPNMLGCDVELAGGNSCGSLEVQDGSSVVGGGDRSRLKDWLNCGGDTSDLADFNMSQIHAHKVFVEMSDSNTCSTPSLNCMPKQAIATTSATSVASSPLDARLHVAAAPRDVFKQDINICGGVEVECKGIEEKDATSSELKVNKVVEVSGGNGGRFERVGIGVVVCDADRLSGDMLRRTRIGVDRNMKPSRRPGFLDESRKNEWCDVFHGSWVWDESYPLYHSKNCSFLDGGFRCNENGRPDSFYTKWRWQLKDCNLPRFDARIMLEMLRNRRLVFAGYSIGRNQWESLLCMLSSVVTNKTSIYEVNGTPITKHSGFLVFKFEEFNCTVEYYRSPFLVLQGHPPAGAVEQVKMTLKVTWATLRLSDDKVKQCVDAKLKGEYPPKGVAKLAAVAALCVQCEAEFRPNMSIVVKDLQQLLKPPAAAPPLEL